MRRRNGEGTAPREYAPGKWVSSITKNGKKHSFYGWSSDEAEKKLNAFINGKQYEAPIDVIKENIEKCSFNYEAKNRITELVEAENFQIILIMDKDTQYDCIMCDEYIQLTINRKKYSLANHSIKWYSDRNQEEDELLETPKR